MNIQYFIVDANKQFLAIEEDNRLITTNVLDFPLYYKTEQMANGMLKTLSSKSFKEKMIIDKDIVFPLRVLKIKVSYEEVE